MRESAAGGPFGHSRVVLSVVRSDPARSGSLISLTKNELTAFLTSRKRTFSDASARLRLRFFVVEYVRIRFEM
jgi:hypothetical protein